MCVSYRQIFKLVALSDIFKCHHGAVPPTLTLSDTRVWINKDVSNTVTTGHLCELSHSLVCEGEKERWSGGYGGGVSEGKVMTFSFLYCKF